MHREEEWLVMFCISFWGVIMLFMGQQSMGIVSPSQAVVWATLTTVLFLFPLITYLSLRRSNC